MLATTFNLSQTVGNVEFPIAACSGLHAFLSNKSKALLWPRSTKAPCSSVRNSDITSSYNCLNDGVILPISDQFNNVIPRSLLP